MNREELLEKIRHAVSEVEPGAENILYGSRSWGMPSQNRIGILLFWLMARSVMRVQTGSGNDSMGLNGISVKSLFDSETNRLTNPFLAWKACPEYEANP